jgi:hypothetical protein
LSQPVKTLLSPQPRGNHDEPSGATPETLIRSLTAA